MLTGLSAFPLTPFYNDAVDEESFIKLIKNLAAAKVDSIGVLGSTGSYMYLSRSERKRVTQLAVQHAEAVPVIVCIGALGTREVLDLAEDAQNAGAHALLLPPVSYQKLSKNEVLRLYDTVCRNINVPLCVYDNPGTTHFDFDNELYSEIAAMRNVASIKIPGINHDEVIEATRLQTLRSCLPANVTLGISGDAFAVTSLNAGCDTWYSVIAGVFPKVALDIIKAAKSGNAIEAQKLSDFLEPLWSFNRRHGSLRVVAAAAEILGLVKAPCLPRPLLSLTEVEKRALGFVIENLQLN